MAERQGCIIHYIVRETGQPHRRYSAGLFQPARIWTLFSGMVFRLPERIPENIAAFCSGRKKEINNTIIYPVLSLYPVRMDIEKRRLVSDGPKNISGYPCSRRNTHSGTGRISDNRKNITHCVIQGSVIPPVIILSNKPE